MKRPVVFPSMTCGICLKLPAILVTGLALAAVNVSTAAEVPGLVAEKPAHGRFVKTDQGYMIPYTVSIPGTDAEIEMVPIPGGTFTMGSPDDEEGRNEDEGPQREVTLNPFWIGKHEVTWAQYKPFMEMYDLFKDFETAGVRQVDEDNRVDAVTAPTPLYDPSFTFLLGEDPKLPAVTMSHYAARQYTKWLSLLLGNQVFRLPSEAEWEYACRAGTQTAYEFGNDASKIDEYAWYYDNSDDAYHEVGQKKPNRWGLHDMHGNVAEIVLDQYREDAYAKSKKKLTGQDAIEWTDSMFPNVTRGGGWIDDPPQLRSAARGQTEDWREEDPNLPKSPWWFTDESALNVGMRIVRPLNPPKEAAERARIWDADSETVKQAVSDRISEGRGVFGLVDPSLPRAAEVQKGR